MRNILIITPICPLPPVHGSHTGMIKHMLWLSKNGYKVQLLVTAPYLSRKEKKYLKAIADDSFSLISKKTVKLVKSSLQETCMRFLVTRVTPRFPKSLRNRIKQFLGLPLVPLVQEGETRSFEAVECPQTAVEVTSWICEKTSPVAVIVYYIFNTKCFEGVPAETLKVINTFDKMSDRQQLVSAYGIEDAWSCSVNYERNCLLCGDLILAVQPEEARAFQEMVPERKVIVFGVAPDIVSEVDESKIVPGRILIVGSDNAANLHGLRHFYENIWPRIREQCNNATLRVVGKISSALSTPDPRVECLGFVEDLSQEYKAAEIVINPTQAGTGLKIKSIEALSHAKALVTWPNGAAGLSFSDEPPALICQDDEEYIESVTRLLMEPELRKTMQMRALHFARENLSESACYKDFQEILEQHIRDHDGKFPVNP